LLAGVGILALARRRGRRRAAGGNLRECQRNAEYEGAQQNGDRARWREEPREAFSGWGRSNLSWNRR
jgi:hypothetical protein